MLVRQIAGFNSSSDADAILYAASRSIGDVLPSPPQLSPDAPTGGSTPPPAAPSPDCQDTTPILWAGLGIGTAWLLAHHGHTQAGTVGKKSPVVPLLIAGAGVAAWYFFNRKSSTPPAATTATTATAVPTNPELNWLLNSFQTTMPANEQAMLAAIPKMSPDEIHWLYIRAKSQLPGNPTEYQAYIDNRATIDAVMAKYNIPGL